MAGNSIRRQIRLMGKYVFPPAMDFVRHAGQVDPFAMYIFEFSHKFDQDDLSHIWQNLMPKIGTQAEYATSKVRHKLLVTELLGDPQAALDNADDGNAPYFSGLPERLQWMVFKVKQRAKRDYFHEIGQRAAPETPFYTYNWPYDHFSLVELAQIQANVKFGQVTEEPRPSVGATSAPQEEVEFQPRRLGELPFVGDGQLEQMIDTFGGVENITAIGDEMAAQRAAGSGISEQLADAGFTPVGGSGTGTSGHGGSGGGLIIPGGGGGGGGTSGGRS